MALSANQRLLGMFAALAIFKVEVTSGQEMCGRSTVCDNPQYSKCCKLLADTACCEPKTDCDSWEAHFCPQPRDLTQAESLGVCIMSEISIGNTAEKTALGFACLRNTKHSYSQYPIPSILQLAKSILDGTVTDTTEDFSGANHWYSPRSMPKEGDPTTGFDVSGGLEGPIGSLTGRNYRPGWALTCTYINVPGVREEYVKFYRCPRDQAKTVKF